MPNTAAVSDLLQKSQDNQSTIKILYDLEHFDLEIASFYPTEDTKSVTLKNLTLQTTIDELEEKLKTELKWNDPIRVIMNMEPKFVGCLK